jgi:hypothetical protein
MRMRSHPWRITISLGLTAALFSAPALAADTGNGSKNFNVPASVPNYFSNEAGPMLGGAAESRRGEVYSGQAAAPAAAPATSAVAAAPRVREHVAMAEPRGRLIRGRRGVPVVARHVAVHGRAVTQVVAHGSSRSRASYASSGSHAAHFIGRPLRVGSSRHRARG